METLQMSHGERRRLRLRQASELLSASNRQVKAELRERMLEPCHEEYSGYDPTLATECLAEEGLAVPVEGELRRPGAFPANNPLRSGDWVTSK